MKFSLAAITLTTVAAISVRGATLPFLGGVNTAGYDFSVATDGSFTGTGVDPPVFQYEHFAMQGVNIFRIPFAWQLMTPTLGGSIDPTFFARYDATVQAALSASSGPYVIVDLHNYARWNGGIINQGGPTNGQYISLWTQLAEKYAGNSKIIFGIMNEPHDLLSVATWVQTVQALVTAVRPIAPNNFLLLPGSSWSSAQAFPTEAGPGLVNVTNPDGTTDNLIFDLHKYLDYDNSGTHPNCTTNNIAVLQTAVNFLKSNGNRQAILSETGGGHTQSCYVNLFEELAFVKENSDTLSFAVWAAGAFATNYTLSVVPYSDGMDQFLWNVAVRPNLPAYY